MTVIDELSEEALDIIRYAAAKGEKFLVDKKIKAKAKGEPKKYLKELEDHELIVRIGHGKFRVTDQGQKYEYEEIGCQDCGAKFFSRIQAENSGGMRCGHNNLSSSIGNFFKKSSTEKAARSHQ